MYIMSINYRLDPDIGSGVLHVENNRFENNTNCKLESMQQFFFFCK